MSQVRGSELIDAPRATVGAALRHTRTAERGLSELGVSGRSTAATALLVPGDELAFRARLGRVPVSLTTRVVRADADALTSVVVAGPVAELNHESTLSDDSGGTLITDSVRWTSPLGWCGRIADAVVVRRLVRHIIARRINVVRELAESWAGRPVVVGAAIVREGRILAQQRHYPAADAGRWELPGGRVDPGETEPEAIVRECQEELGVDVRPTGRVGTDVPLDNGMLLRIHTAELRDPQAQPQAVEHRDIRWVGASGLTDLDWLDADRVLIHSLRELLRDT